MRFSKLRTSKIEHLEGFEETLGKLLAENLIDLHPDNRGRDASIMKPLREREICSAKRLFGQGMGCGRNEKKSVASIHILPTITYVLRQNYSLSFQP